MTLKFRNDIEILEAKLSCFKSTEICLTTDFPGFPAAIVLSSASRRLVPQVTRPVTSVDFGPSNFPSKLRTVLQLIDGGHMLLICAAPLLVNKQAAFSQHRLDYQ